MLTRTTVVMVAVTAASGVAVAQPVVDPRPIPSQTRVVYVAPPGDDALTNLGFTMMAGGGIEVFTGSELRATTGVAGNWNVRASIGTKQRVTFEAQYFGSLQTIDALGLATDATLVGNGLQGSLRVNLVKRAMVQPFVYGGVAWRNYALRTAGQNRSDVEDRDNVLEVPVGVGLAYRYAGLVLDLRGELRLVSDSDLIRASSADSPSMHRFGMNANLGYEF